MQLDAFIQNIFRPLGNAPKYFPSRGELKEELNHLAPKRGDSADRLVTSSIIRLFATASIEMWLRSVHSFLVSASLTDASPMWASISGYYSSHYIMRAIAHLLGLFHLRDRRLTVTLSPSASGFICQFRQGKRFHEHSYYWEKVKEHPYFNSNYLLCHLY
jgi:hypothetical protein